MTKDGYMVVSSEKTRKQILNQADCLAKLRMLIWESSVKPHEPTAEELKKLQQRLFFFIMEYLYYLNRVNVIRYNISTF